MPELVAPDERYRESFLAAMAEFDEEGRRGDGSMVGDDMARFASTWGGEDGFAAYVALLRRDAEVPRYDHWVTTSNFFWVEDIEYLGRIAVRHTLNDSLLQQGGHIGYDVRRSARRRGHATAMLTAVLPHCRDLGIDPVLVTCDADNLASRRTIERNGGVLEDRRGDKLRFWIETGGVASTTAGSPPS